MDSRNEAMDRKSCEYREDKTLKNKSYLQEEVMNTRDIDGVSTVIPAEIGEQSCKEVECNLILKCI